jgi:hypothetical protein
MAAAFTITTPASARYAPYQRLHQERFYLYLPVQFFQNVIIAAGSRAIGYTTIPIVAPFPVVCIAFVFIDLGLSILNARGNGILSMLGGSSVENEYGAS